MAKIVDRSAEIQAPPAHPPRRSRLGGLLAWAGGWGALAALALWTARLTPGWLVAAALGAALWTAAAHVGRGWRAGGAAALLLAVSIGGAAQFRLGEISRHWPRVQAAAEERAGAALDRGLNELFDRGSVVDDTAALGGNARATAGLFARVERLRRESGVTALAVYLPDGSPLVWAGEHRGKVPGAVSSGALGSSFSEGPLFGYLYFSRRLGGGRVAVSAVLLESHVEVGEGARPFADAFEARYGLRPRFVTPERAPRDRAVWDYETADQKILSVYFDSLRAAPWRERLAARARWWMALAWTAAALALSAAWYRGGAGPPGVPVAVITASLVLFPLERMTGGGVFSPVGFVLPGDFSLGQLLIVLSGAAVWLLARPRVARAIAQLPFVVRVGAAAGALVLALAVVRRAAAPMLEVREAGGVPLIAALALLAAIPLLALLGQAERAVPRRRRAEVVLLAMALSAALGTGVVAWWEPGRVPPVWTAALWAVPFALAAAVLTRAQIGRGALLPWVAMVWIGGTLALPHLWVTHLNARLSEAEAELGRLGTQVDPYLDFLLRELPGHVLRLSAEGRRGVPLLYQAWVEAGLAAEGHEARLSLWEGENETAYLRLSDTRIPREMEVEVLRRARGAEEPLVERYTDNPMLHYLVAVALPDGRTVTVAVPPRRHLGRSMALARFVDPAGPAEAETGVASLTLVPAAGARAAAPDSMRWVRSEEGWRSETTVVFPGAEQQSPEFPAGPQHAHLTVATPPPPILAARAVLAQVLLLVIATLLWAVARTLCGEPLGLEARQWGWLWTFRGRLTLALFAFFLVPMAIFAATAYRALSREVARTAGALADRALAQAASEIQGGSLDELAAHVGADLLLYHRGELAEAAAQEVIDLGLYHAWLPPRVFLGFAVGEETAQQERRRLAGNEYLMAYRAFAPADVLASPTPLATGEIARRQRELADVVLLAGLLGAGLSVVLSLLVGRALSRPIDAMSAAAVAVGAGDLTVRLPAKRRDEFGALFRAFNRMVRGLRQARGALVAETRRTETIVAEAGTGVVALDASGRVALINPRAEQILGADVPVGARIPEVRPLEAAVAGAVRGFLASGAREWTEEREVDGRVVRLRLRRLPGEEGRGAVLVLEDVTAEIRSARVLAWGEMARQVAHEIKNPLTPIKLAVQHVRRAWKDGRDDFGSILDRNVDSVLAEIDRLGEIARSFSRFGAPADPSEPLERVDVRRVAEDTLALYRGGDDGISYSVELADGVPPVRAREGELREVLVNVLENARAALDGGGEVRISAAPEGGGQWVRIDVRDTGEGIAPELLPRIFEPKFSTKTSGTGLGLAIVRRLVESWGGEITVDSAVGEGTTVHLRLRTAEEGAG